MSLINATVLSLREQSTWNQQRSSAYNSCETSQFRSYRSAYVKLIFGSAVQTPGNYRKLSSAMITFLVRECGCTYTIPEILYTDKTSVNGHRRKNNLPITLWVKRKTLTYTT
jgi:hypothetical protein